MAFRTACALRIAALVLLCAALVAPPTAWADELVGPPPPLVGPPAPPTLTENVMNALDTPRDYLSGKFVGFISQVDQFFGDERHYQETNDSVFQLDVVRVMGYGGEHNFVLVGRANVHLPIAEKKLHLVLESDPDKSASVDPKQSQVAPIRQPTAPQSYGAALRFIREEAQRWHFSADGGLKFHGLSTTPFVRSRASLEKPVDDWRLKLAETVFWFNTVGVGETTQLDLDRPISGPLLFRATSIAAWLRNTQNFDLRQDFALFHTLDERTALLYQASVVGASQPIARVADYVLLMQYRYRLHRKWMYFDVSPQLHFPWERSYKLNPSLSLRLEILFDESR